MSSVPLTIVEGTASSEQVRFHTATDLAGDVRIEHTTGTTAHTAATLISLTSAAVNINAAATSATGTLTVDGDVTAKTKVITNEIQTKVPGTDTLVVTAKKIKLDADEVEITGMLNTITTTELLVKDKLITLGAVDANEDNVPDINDTTRDQAGFVIAGVPANLPAGKDPVLYEHHMKWLVKEGDFLVGGTEVAPHRKPIFEFNGGALAISAPDVLGRKATFTIAPYFTSTTASLGIYYSLEDGRAKLMQTFSADVFAPAPPVWVTTSPLTNAVINVAYSVTLNATNAVSYSLAPLSSFPAGLTITNVGAVWSLSGTPTVATTTSFVIRATTSQGGTADRTFTLTVTL